eukprot:1137465-Pelagomonas_calceolata.AAC.1
MVFQGLSRVAHPSAQRQPFVKPTRQVAVGLLRKIRLDTKGGLQPDRSADRPVTGPRQSTWCP